MADDLNVTRKAEVLIEALPYIQRFKGSIFVVKYGGSFVEDPVARDRVAADVALLAAVGIRVVVVHGGGKAITRAMAAAGIEPEFRNGLRVTDEASVAIVEQTLNGEINREICEMLGKHGAASAGIPGQDVFVCERLERTPEGESVDLGFVGDTREVRTEPIERALAMDLTPVVSPIAADKEGRIYNTNADSAAAVVAATLRARRLVYLSDVPGLLRDSNDPESLISSVDTHEITRLKRAGAIGRGMLPKLDSAVEALKAGVHRVHFVDGRVAHSILLEIFTDRGIGTEIVHPSHATEPWPSDAGKSESTRDQL